MNCFKQCVSVLACVGAACAMEPTSVTWTNSTVGTVSWENAANWAEGAAPAITNNLDLSSTNLTVVFKHAPKGLQVINNPWTQESGGGNAALSLHALEGGAMTEFDIWYSNFCRPLVIRDPSTYLGLWAIPSGNQHGAGSVMQLASDAAWTSRVNRVSLSGRIGFRVPTGAMAVVEHPQGEGVFEVNRSYPRVPVNVTVSGTLDLPNSPGGESYLSLHAGSVILHGRPGGNTPGFVSGAAVHLDASAAGAFETYADGGVTRVSTWKAAAGTSVSAVSVGSAVVADPTLVTDAATGKSVLDFGDLVTGTVQKKGTSAGLVLDTPLENVCELFAVFRDKSATGNRPQIVGWGLAEGYRHFLRLNDAQIFSTSTADTMPVRAGEIRLDDQSEPANATWDFSRRLNVVSAGINTHITNGVPVRYLAMGDMGSRIGGIQLAEILLYTNSLTTAQRRQNNAVLLRKWRAADEAQVWDYGELRFVSSVPEVTVAEGTVAVREITLAANTTALVKKGPGTLLIGRLSNRAIRIDVQEGAVRFAADVTRAADPKPAADPYCWFDATAASSLVSAEQGIAKWQDRRDGTNHYGTALYLATPATQAKLSDGTTASYPNATVDASVAGGLTMVSLGETCLLDSQKVTDLGDSTYLRLYADNTLQTGSMPHVREGYVVYYTTDGKANPIASSDYTFTLLTSSALTCFVRQEYSHSYAIGGYWRYDGKVIDPTSCANTKGEVHIVSFRMATRLAINAFCTDRGSSRNQIGGAKIGEVLYYDRVLTDQERRDTEAYLFKKWKGTASPEDMQAALPQPSLALPSEGEDTELGTEQEATCRITGVLGPRLDFTGSGRFVCTDAVTSVTREITLSGGGELDLAVDFDLCSNAWFHVDAMQASSVGFLSSGSNAVSSWADVHANGLKANSEQYSSNGNILPTRVNAAMNDTGLTRPVMDFGEWYNGKNPTNSASTMTWSERTALQEFYIVQRDKGLHQPNSAIAADKEYPCVLGQRIQNCDWAGADYYYKDSDQIAFYRDTEALLTKWPQPRVYNGYIGVNGEKKSGAFKPVTNTFYVYSFQLTAPDYHVQTFARRDDSQKGGQQVAEMVCFAATNTAARRTEIENYLLRKWLGKGAAFTWPMDRVAFADAAKLRLRLNVAERLSLAALEYVFDGKGVGCLTVDGTLVLPTEGTLALDVSAKRGGIAYGTYPIVRATVLEGGANLAAWSRTVTRSGGSACEMFVRTVPNGVNLVVAPRASLLIIR